MNQITSAAALAAELRARARQFGWSEARLWPAGRSPAGWPDLVLTRPAETLLVFLLPARGGISPPVYRTARLLRRCERIRVVAWRRSDAGAALRALAGAGAVADYAVGEFRRNGYPPAWRNDARFRQWLRRRARTLGWDDYAAPGTDSRWVALLRPPELLLVAAGGGSGPDPDRSGMNAGTLCCAVWRPCDLPLALTRLQARQPGRRR